MNTITRIGKIARLPHSIREQLNLRLHDHQPHKTILPWLNSLPEAQAILAAEFDSRPITKQNLSEWKQGGFRDWLLQYHASQFLQFLPSSSSSSLPPTEFQDSTAQSQDLSHSFTHHASRITDHPTRTTDSIPPHTASHPASSIEHPVSASSLTAKLLLWTQLQYTTMARHIDAETDPERKWTALRQFSNDISRLRRSSLADDYLQIQRDWLALSQSNSSEKKELEFCKWINRPDIADAIKNKKRGLTREHLRKIEEDLYLLGPDDPSLDEHIAQVQLAKELMARRKAKEAEAKRQPGDPAPEQPRINLRDTTFEELFPTIPDKPLTELYPELDPMDPDRGNISPHKRLQRKTAANMLPILPIGPPNPLSQSKSASVRNKKLSPIPRLQTKIQQCPIHPPRPTSLTRPPGPTRLTSPTQSNPVQPNPTKSSRSPPLTPIPTQTMKTHFNASTL
jgi:hypothetical protein